MPFGSWLAGGLGDLLRRGWMGAVGAAGGQRAGLEVVAMHFFRVTAGPCWQGLRGVTEASERPECCRVGFGAGKGDLVCLEVMVKVVS